VNQITYGLGDQRDGFLVTYGLGGLVKLGTRITEVLRFGVGVTRVFTREVTWKRKSCV